MHYYLQKGSIDVEIENLYSSYEPMCFNWEVYAYQTTVAILPLLFKARTETLMRQGATLSSTEVLVQT